MVEHTEYGRDIEALVREWQRAVEVSTDKFAARAGPAREFKGKRRQVDTDDPRRIDTVQQPEILPGAAADIEVPCTRAGTELLQEIEAELASIAAPPVRRLHRENLPVEFWLHWPTWDKTWASKLTTA